MFSQAVFWFVLMFVVQNVGHICLFITISPFIKLELLCLFVTLYIHLLLYIFAYLQMDFPLIRGCLHPRLYLGLYSY